MYLEILLFVVSFSSLIVFGMAEMILHFKVKEKHLVFLTYRALVDLRIIFSQDLPNRLLALCLLDEFRY